MVRPLAEQGYAEAVCFLGTLYEDGKGVSRSYEKALDCYRQAAADGYAMAVRCIGVMYDYGKGVNRDAVKAFG